MALRGLSRKTAILRDGGFTLIELLAVLFILTLLLSAAAVFSFGSLGPGRLDSAARDLTALFRRAQTEARTGGSARTVAIDLDRRTCSYEGKNVTALPDGIAAAVVDDRGTAAKTGTVSFLFRSFGTAEPAVIVLSTGRRSLRVRLDPVVGAVTERGT